MAKLFNIENPLFTSINKFVDMIFLSLIVDLICLPAIFTGIMAFDLTDGFYGIMAFIFVLAMALVGPAFTALYYASAKSVRRDRGYAVSEFFKAYKSNFKLGAIISLILGAFVALMVLDFFVLKNVNPVKVSESTSSIIKAVLRALCVIAGMGTIYVFPMLSRFNLKFKQLLFSALMMSIRHLPKTILLVLIDGFFGAGPVLAAWLMGAESMEQYLTICIPLYLFFPGIGALLSTLVIEKIFKTYIKKGIEDRKQNASENGEDSEEEDTEDRWYLE